MLVPVVKLRLDCLRQATARAVSIQQVHPMFIPDGDVDVLARDMIKHFPADAADRAMLRSNAFFVLGRAETGKKWLLVTEEIKKIQAGQVQ